MKTLPLLLLLSLSFSCQLYAQCTYTSNSNGSWSGSNWSSSGGGCNADGEPTDSTTGGGISTGETININHSITVGANLQINNGTRIVINNGGTLDMTGFDLATSWGNPVITINPGGTLIMDALSFAHGTFTNSGTINATGNMTFTAGTVYLSKNASATSYITSPNIHVTSTSVFVYADEPLEVTGNLHANSGSTIEFNANTTVSGYINFAGGQDMTVSAGVLLESPEIYVQNSSNLVVDGFLNATTSLEIGWTPSGAQSGSSKISGSGNIGWGTLSIDNNNNWIECMTGTNYGYCGGCSAPPPPFNPLDLTDCDAGVLPVNIADFHAEFSANCITLNWTTVSEKNNDYFVIERFDESKVWREIALVDGAGNSDDILSYSFSDYTFSPSGNYYRIKQVDFNGRSTYSGVIFSEAPLEKNGISPQPLSGTFLNVNYPGAISWKISTLSGRLIGSGGIIRSREKTGIDVSSFQLKQGVYLIFILTDDDSYQEKLIVN